MNDIYSILDKAKNLGYSAEVFHVKLFERDVNVATQTSNKDLYEEGYGLRIMKDCKLGFSYSNTLHEDILDSAINVFNAVSEKDCNYQIPSPEGKVNYLSTIHLLSFNELTNKEEELNKQIRDYSEDLKKSGINIVEYNLSAFEVEIEVVNTEGIDVKEKKSGIGVFFIINKELEGGTVTPEIYEYTYSSNPKDINLEQIIEEVKDKVVKLERSNKKDIDKDIDVIFTPKALSELFMPLFSHAISVENVSRGKSPLSQLSLLKNEKLTIIDDPQYAYALASRSFDSEGLPTSPTVLVDNGKINSFLSNTYWSKKANVKNTHSATRTYLTLPTISPTNIRIEFSEIGDVFYGKALVVDQVQGVHTSDFDTGNFSVNVSLGWYFDGNEESGKYNVVLNGNIIDLINGMKVMTKDSRRYGNIVTGMVRVRGLKVV
ncbi:MAG: TldD/PmbA family protein [Sulfolobus sp.]|nr:TldD/PmbA family protein [Sulfolobus sp.]